LGACPQGDFSCRAQCQIDHPAGTEFKVSALSACLVTHCEKECGLTCGALAGWAVEPDAAVPFQTCMASNSCDQVRACASSAACDAVVRCIPACPSDDCTDTCMASRGLDIAWFYAPPDAGKSALTSTYADFVKARTTCSSVAGNYWECVGHLSWRPVNAAYTALQTKVEELGAGPFAQLEVAVCGVPDTECSTPWASGQTDDAGMVTLQVPLPNAGPALHSFARMRSTTTSSTQVIPTYAYEAWPLTEARHISSQGRITGDQSGYPVGTSSAVALEQSASGVTPDPTRGIVAVVVKDCMGVRAPGVSVALSTADSQTVTVDSQFVRSGSIVDTSGGLDFLNAPVGPARVTANAPGIGPLGTVDVSVRRSATTFVVFRPTPL
jgi:hypothetical protein